MPKREPPNVPWELWGNVRRAKHRVWGLWVGRETLMQDRRQTGSQGSWRGGGEGLSGSGAVQGGAQENLSAFKLFVFKATECSLHTKPTLEIQYEKYMRPALEGAPQGGPTRVSMGHRHRRTRKREVPDEDGASSRAVCVGGSAPSAAAPVPTSFLPPHPSRPHTANSLFLPLWCVFEYEKTNSKDQERKNRNLEYVGIFNLFCPWDKVSILRGINKQTKKKNCYTYLVTYCSLYFWKVDYIRNEIGPMVAQVKMGFRLAESFSYKYILLIKNKSTKTCWLILKSFLIGLKMSCCTAQSRFLHQLKWPKVG